MPKRPLKLEKAPRLRSSEPLFVRLCSAFVDNLGILLKTAFVFGSVLLVQNLLVLLEETREAPPRAVEILRDDEPAIAEEKPEHAAESFMSEGVQRALNCTYQAYRDAHYDECVEEPSDVYRHPQPDADDRGWLEQKHEVLFAAVIIEPQAEEL